MPGKGRITYNVPIDYIPRLSLCSEPWIIKTHRLGSGFLLRGRLCLSFVDVFVYLHKLMFISLICTCKVLLILFFSKGEHAQRVDVNAVFAHFKVQVIAVNRLHRHRVGHCADDLTFGDRVARLQCCVFCKRIVA